MLPGSEGLYLRIRQKKNTMKNNFFVFFVLSLFGIITPVCFASGNTEQDAKFFGALGGFVGSLIDDAIEKSNSAGSSNSSGSSSSSLYITVNEYASASEVGLFNSSNARELVDKVNALLARVGSGSVTITDGARTKAHDATDDSLHYYSKAVDLRYNESLYNALKANIAGSGLRLECITCIRRLGQTDHIHLDLGRGDAGRWFHASSGCTER